jgi:protein-tyrosine phosphatase
MIDLHCHILPGLDDGAATLDDALEMARRAQEEGVEIIVAAPHVFRDNFDWGDFSIIEKKRRELAEAVQANNIQVKILRGAEVHISHGLINAVKKNRSSLVLNGSSYMLVEFPPNHIFPGIKKLFFELMAEGITPIITHPERNIVFIENPVLLYELVQSGALAQANTGSFLGLYGDRAQKAVSLLLELNLVHFIASDGHSPHSLSTRLKEAVEKAAIIAGEERARALAKDNPEAVIADRDLPFLRPPVSPKEKEKPLSVKMPGFLRRKH